MCRVCRDNLIPAQQQRLARFDCSQSVDMHCHCLPGLDDGPATTAEALELCRALSEDGITSVIATTHQLGRYDGRCESPRIQAAVASLNQALDKEALPLKVFPGADVRVDERIPDLLADGAVLSLANLGKHLLLELPEQVFIDLQALTADLAKTGLQVIVSHPERNWFLSKHPQVVLPWLREGACLQLTAGSLLGSFGPMAETMSWYWLSKGLACVVASDAHDTTGRRPRMAAERYDDSDPVNLGAGLEITIKDLVEKIKDLVNREGLGSEDIKNLTVSALLARLALKGKDASIKEEAAGLQGIVKSLGAEDLMAMWLAK